MNGRCGCLIHDINYSCYRFNSKVIWQILLIQHGTCIYNVLVLPFNNSVATPLWVKCEDETHIPKSGNLESSRTPENSEL
jgi:hypothetical protein